MTDLQNKVDKVITIRFALTDNPLSNEAIFKLSDFHGKDADKARTERLTEWYKCWKAEQERQYEGVAGG